MKYISIIHKDKDSAYGISFPDLEGCFSAADTWEEIGTNAIEALELFLEDQDAPSPSSTESIVDTFSEDLRNGAVLMAVPYIPKKTKVVRANISMEKGLLDAIDQAAKESNLTRSSFLAHAAQKEIMSA